jgi:hypothetical protein
MLSTVDANNPAFFAFLGFGAKAGLTSVLPRAKNTSIAGIEKTRQIRTINHVLSVSSQDCEALAMRLPDGLGHSDGDGRKHRYCG